MSEHTTEDPRVTEARAKLHALPGGKNEPETFLPLVVIDEAGLLPTFPIDTLPSWVADYASAVAASTRFSIDMAAGFGLGALSAALGGCAHVLPSEDWHEPVNLYLAIIAEPSEGKSPVFRRMMAPIFDLDRELAKEHAARYAYDCEMRKVAESRVGKLRSTIEREPGNQTAVTDLRDLTKEIAVPVKAIPRLAVGDVTAERLGAMLQEQGERLAILSPEDTLWAHVGGRYSDSPSVEVYLSAYTGEAVRVDRASRTVVLDNPCLTICVAMQPAVLSGGGSKLAGDRGLLARFLYITPPRMVGYRDHSTDPPPIPPDVEAEYTSKLGHLARLNLRIGATPHRVPIRLNARARADWRAWQCALERRRRDDGDLYPIRGWAGKAEGAALRLAGVIALADAAIEITPAHLASATTLIEYFAAHARRALGLSVADDRFRLAVRILAWIERRVVRASEGTASASEVTGVNPDLWFARRRCWQENRSWLTSTTTADACDLLCNHGYLLAEKRGKAPGYLVNREGFK